VARSPWATSASNAGGGVPGSLSKSGSRPSVPLRSARMSSHTAWSRNKTGDPSDPWLMASAPRLNWAWASSYDSLEVSGPSVGPSSCWASRQSWGVPVMGCEEVDVGPVVTMRNGDGRHVKGELGRVSRPVPPSSLSAGGTGSVSNVRKASTFASAVGLKSGQPGCCPVISHDVRSVAPSCPSGVAKTSGAVKVAVAPSRARAAAR